MDNGQWKSLGTKKISWPWVHPTPNIRFIDRFLEFDIESMLGISPERNSCKVTKKMSSFSGLTPFIWPKVKNPFRRPMNGGYFWSLLNFFLTFLWRRLPEIIFLSLESFTQNKRWIPGLTARFLHRFENRFQRRNLGFNLQHGKYLSLVLMPCCQVILSFSFFIIQSSLKLEFSFSVLLPDWKRTR